MIIAAFCAILCRLLAGVVKWQTRRTQNPMLETTCGFKSHRQHQKKRRSLQEGINHRFLSKHLRVLFFLHDTANGTFEVRIRADGKRFRHNKRRRITHDCRRKISANVEKPLQDAFCVTKKLRTYAVFCDTTAVQGVSARRPQRGCGTSAQAEFCLKTQANVACYICRYLI